MTLEEMCAAALARDPAKQAIEYEHRWFNWGELRRVADRVRALIDESGTPPGAAVAFMPRPRPSAAAALLGMISASRSVRMVYAFQSPTALARDIAKLRPPVLIGGESDFSDELVETMRSLGIAGIALEEMDAHFVPGLETSSVELDPQAPARAVETLTSGTTGPPKRFPLYFDLIATRFVAGKGAADTAGFGSTPILLPMPMGNFSGIYGLLPTLINGLRIVLQDQFTLAGWRDFISRYPSRLAYLPPAAVQMVLDADIPKEELAAIEAITTGAAPLDANAQREFEERYGIAILYAYGATEFGGTVAEMTPALHAEYGKRKYGSVGRPVAGVQLRVVDPETGEAQPAGKEGVVEALLPHMGSEWIRTSDLALIDEEGFVFHRGRADGAIVRGGFKLVPETIERALMLHDGIAVVSVVGVPDRRLGQLPAVAIQLKAGVAAPGIDELEAHLRGHLLSTHIPTLWRFVEAMPLNASMKVDRAAVSRLFQEEATA